MGKQTQYTKIPYKFIQWHRELGISPEQFEMICHIESCRSKDGESFIGNEELARRMRKSTKTITRWFNYFRDMGYLTRNRGGINANHDFTPLWELCDTLENRTSRMSLSPEVESDILERRKRHLELEKRTFSRREKDTIDVPLTNRTKNNNNTNYSSYGAKKRDSNISSPIEEKPFPQSTPYLQPTPQDNSTRIDELSPKREKSEPKKGESPRGDEVYPEDFPNLPEDAIRAWNQAPRSDKLYYRNQAQQHAQKTKDPRAYEEIAIELYFKDNPVSTTKEKQHTELVFNPPLEEIAKITGRDPKEIILGIFEGNREILETARKELEVNLPFIGGASSSHSLIPRLLYPKVIYQYEFVRSNGDYKMEAENTFDAG